VTREIPLFTLEGVSDADVTTHYFSTADGLGLSLLRFNRDRFIRDGGEPCGDSVMIVHGLTTSSDMFIMPEHENLVSYLLDHGFTDVWCLDMRMSNRHSYNLTPHRWTFDDVALYDYPPAIDLIRSHIGPERGLHVIAHCLGSLSFLMSLFGKAIAPVTSVIANSVGLTPRVPRWSQLKLRVAPTMVEHVLGLGYLNPRWSQDPGFTRGELFARLVSASHHECDVPECHMLSMMWGSGRPALYHHENLADVTHRRSGDLYGPTSMNYYRHVNAMVRAGSRAVKYDPDDERFAALPDDYFAYVDEIRTPVLLTTGADNRVFADSNQVCHRRFREFGCDQHELVVYPGYGHQDVFMGERVAQDCFPPMLDFLNKHRVSAPTPGTVG